MMKLVHGFLLVHSEKPRVGRQQFLVEYCYAALRALGSI